VSSEVVMEPVRIPAVGASRLLVRLSNYRLFLAVFTIFVAFYVGLQSSLLPPIFTAYARLLPPQTNTSTATSLLNQVGGAAVLGSSALTLKNPSDLYASLFFSRSVQDDVIAKFRLAEHYGIDDVDVLRSEIAKRTKVDVGKDGIITLSYTDKTSARAADIANAMIEAMYKIAQRLSRSEAVRRSDFYDILITDARKRLADAIEELRLVENKTGLTRLKGQEEGSAAALVELQGQIASREVELQKMAQTATSRHPEVVRVQAELSALRQQMYRLFPQEKRSELEKQYKDKTNKLPPEKIDLLLPFHTYANSRAIVEPPRRMVENYANVLEQLIKAQALSKVDETRDFSAISILDEAVAPTRKSGPRIYINAAVGGLVGFLLAVMLALAWDILFTDPTRRARWGNVYRSFLRKGR
jgi:tyrosine-protein kinase Etk/Wzc